MTRREHINELEIGGIDIPNRNVIDVSNHGYAGDMTGGDIVTLFRDNPNSVFILPAGDYAVQSSLDLTDDASWDELAIIGKPHARLVVDDTAVDYLAWLGSSSGGTFSELRLQNLSLVVDGANSLDAGWGRFWIDDLIDNRNLSIEGTRDRYDGGDGSGGAAGGDRFCYYADITTESGVGYHRNIQLTDGDTPYDSFDRQGHAIAIGSETAHVGTNLWIGCGVEEFWDNGFYVKDGEGQNILIGCYARNCGGSNIRLGTSDAAYACQSYWNYDLANNAGYAGTLLDSDEGVGTTVDGFRAINDSSTTEAVRIRSNSEVATYSNMYIENNTSQFALRIRSSSGDHEQGALKMDTVRIRDTGDTSIRSAAAEVDRPNVHLTDLSITTQNAGASRSCLKVANGGARVDGMSYLDSGATDYSVIAGHGDGSSVVERILIDGIYMNGGVYIYDSTDDLQVLQLLDNDLRDVGTLYPNMDSTNFTTSVSRDNIGVEV